MITEWKIAVFLLILLFSSVTCYAQTYKSIEPCNTRHTNQAYNLDSQSFIKLLPENVMHTTAICRLPQHNPNPANQLVAFSPSINFSDIGIGDTVVPITNPIQVAFSTGLDNNTISAITSINKAGVTASINGEAGNGSVTTDISANTNSISATGVISSEIGNGTVSAGTSSNGTTVTGTVDTQATGSTVDAVTGTNSTEVTGTVSTEAANTAVSAGTSTNGIDLTGTINTPAGSNLVNAETGSNGTAVTGTADTKVGTGTVTAGTSSNGTTVTETIGTQAENSTITTSTNKKGVNGTVDTGLVNTTINDEGDSSHHHKIVVKTYDHQHEKDNLIDVKLDALISHQVISYFAFQEFKNPILNWDSDQSLLLDPHNINKMAKGCVWSLLGKCGAIHLDMQLNNGQLKAQGNLDNEIIQTGNSFTIKKKIDTGIPEVIVDKDETIVVNVRTGAASNITTDTATSTATITASTNAPHSESAVNGSMNSSINANVSKNPAAVNAVANVGGNVSTQAGNISVKIPAVSIKIP